jgi:transposase
VKYLHKRKEKHHVLGALSEDNFFYQFSEENFNSNIFEQFVLSLIENFRKVVIVVDRARYHTSYYMQDVYEQHKDCLHVEYFPSYSPELNPTELVWREVKNGWLVDCGRTKMSYMISLFRLSMKVLLWFQSTIIYYLNYRMVWAQEESFRSCFFQY